MTEHSIYGVTMASIELPPNLITPLQQLATEQGSSVEEVIEDALTDYLRERRHKHLLQ
jgi:metal-responsive CopG/Arc/MetJ family transcriptional regulator